MKISFFKALSLIGLLAEEITMASADGKITVREAINIVEKICERLGIDFDKTGVKIEETNNTN